MKKSTAQVTGTGFQGQAPATPGGVASVPGGPSNIPLNGSGGGAQVNPAQAKQMLQQMLQAFHGGDMTGLRSIASRMQAMVPSIKDPQTKKILQSVANTAMFNSNSQTLTPGKPTVPQVVSQALAAISSAEAMNKIVQQPNPNVPAKATDNPTVNVYMTPQQQMQQQQKTSQVIKKKKKTRGNPFKVLMGKVGKMIDHGMTKSQIVRRMRKEGHWEEQTVQNAIDIVKDYNKKKKHKGKSAAAEYRNITAGVSDMDSFERYTNVSTTELLLKKEFLEAYNNDVELARDVDAAHPGFVPAQSTKELAQVMSVLKDRGYQE